MRKLIVGAFVLASTLTFAQKSTTFRDYKFGTDVGAIPHLAFVESGKKNKQLKFYERMDEVTSIGKYQVDKITYGFYKDKLCLINFKFKDKRAKNQVKLDASLFGNGYDETKLEKGSYQNGRIILK